MKYLIFVLLLRPLIRRNYAAREAAEIPDEWYWADALALRWGYYIKDWPYKAAPETQQ